MNVLVIILLFVCLLIDLFFSECLYNQIKRDDGECGYCYLEGANFEGCLRCMKIEGFTECVECSSGYTPQLSNGRVQRCVTLCTKPDQLAGIITNEAGTDNCNINLWSSSQYNVPSYDMISMTKPTSDLQKVALQKFYVSMNGPLWKKNTNWNVGDPCTNFWHGIACNINGDIFSMVFGENRMRGILPTEIINLKSLEELTIFNPYDSYSDYTNRLYNIEKRINELYSLKVLVLRNLNITDSLSSSIYSFSKLEVLDLSFNKIEGILTNSITNLKNLKRFNIANNKIKGSLNIFNSFTGSLEIIELQNNEFESNVPSLDNLASSLKIFDFTNNKIFGGVPTNYFEKKKFVKFIYMGLMLNPKVTVPIQCERQPFCFSFLFEGFRNANDLDFILNDGEKMYLRPIETVGPT